MNDDLENLEIIPTVNLDIHLLLFILPRHFSSQKLKPVLCQVPCTLCTSCYKTPICLEKLRNMPRHPKIFCLLKFAFQVIQLFHQASHKPPSTGAGPSVT
jgi:hypothetical protein